MSRAATLIILMLLIFFGTAQAEDQLQLNTAACNEMKDADATLNQVYKKVLAKYQDDEIFINKFVAAQKNG